MAEEKPFDFPLWRDAQGAPLSCHEKIKVMNENLAELRAMAQDALEDGLLMGADESQLRETLEALMASLTNPYKKEP